MADSIKISIIFLFFSALSFAEEPRGVPEALFEIKLGGVYDVGDSENKQHGNIPIKKFTGMNRFLGNGIHYYFEPKKEYKIFKYIEKRNKPEDQYYETSFRLYLLPVVPSSITTKEQLENAKLNWEVTVIEWSNDAIAKEDAYFWAIDLCKTFEVGISVKPEITDSFDEKWYQCIFSSGDREFKVSSSLPRSISLSYKKDVWEAKNNAVDRFIRKLKLDEIRPY